MNDDSIIKNSSIAPAYLGGLEVGKRLFSLALEVSRTMVSRVVVCRRRPDNVPEVYSMRLA